VVQIATIYSQNGEFYLESIPFDNEFPTTRGRTTVYRTGNSDPLYDFEQGFDSIGSAKNNLILSNDGQVIFYAISWGADETKPGLHSVSVFRQGKLVRSYSQSEINGCALQSERCSLLYSNFDEVVDRDKSNAGIASYRKTYKAGVSEEEKFLSDFPIFSADDIVYLIDSKRTLHRFDLQNDGNLVSSEQFAGAFAEIRSRASFPRTDFRTIDDPVFMAFPKLANGKPADTALASALGMAVHDIFTNKHERYKFYSFKLSGMLFRDGRFVVDEIDVSDSLAKDKILAFFATTKFAAAEIPKEADRWYVGEQFFFLHRKDLKLARREKVLEDLANQKEYLERQVAERIGEVYIPKDLGECFTELDRFLPEVDRKEMQALANRGDMILYHLGLGMWMRNNWSLRGSSRLQKYFLDKGISDAEEMSTVILFYYYDWLNGKKDTWRDWEKNPKDAD
jgi:hypothetical protein